MDEFSSDDAALLLFYASGKPRQGAAGYANTILNLGSTVANLLFYGMLTAIFLDVFDHQAPWFMWTIWILILFLYIGSTMRRQSTRRKLAPFAAAVQQGQRNVGACLECDYNVTGVESDMCPECGEPIVVESILLQLQREIRNSESSLE